jgi:erythronate-4-phosphate dehydrogenase
MKIVADVDLPFLDSMFGARAELVRLKGSAITSAAVKDADAVIVRSVTKVDERLLAGSSVSFVGTATIGVDHVDTAWLASRGIGFASAPGCNANAVSEYVTAALLELAARFGFRLSGAVIGVVGVGNVGSRVASKAAALGMRVLLNDPPLARAGGPGRFLPLDDLMECDVVTLHVPLTKSGPDATHHFFDAGRIGMMKPGAILINSARGAVVDTAALPGALAGGRLRAAVADVWEGEPSVDPGLLSRVAIATAHIAGYSADGKAAASVMMHDALCAHFGLEDDWRLGDRLPPPDEPLIDPGGRTADPEEVLREVVRRAYPIMRDDAAMRKLVSLAPPERPGYFIGLRNDYPFRREFHAVTVRGTGGPGFPSRELAGLGFRLS